MKKLVLFVLTLVVFEACHNNSITGRKQLALFPESTLQKQSVTEYRSFLSQNKVLSENVNKDAEMVFGINPKPMGHACYSCSSFSRLWFRFVWNGNYLIHEIFSAT